MIGNYKRKSTRNETTYYNRFEKTSNVNDSIILKKMNFYSLQI